jgi:hypothetical protein
MVMQLAQIGLPSEEVTRLVRETRVRGRSAVKRIVKVLHNIVVLLLYLTCCTGLACYCATFLHAAETETGA